MLATLLMTKETYYPPTSKNKIPPWEPKGGSLIFPLSCVRA